MSFVNISEVLIKYPHLSLIDIRDEDAYKKDHIPTAINIPLQYNPDIKKDFLLSYKSQEVSDNLFLDIKHFEHLLSTNSNSDHPTFFYCQDGGFLSKALAYYFEQKGSNYSFISQGYKGFCREQQQFFNQNWKICLLTGLSGVGKTKILHALQKGGQQVIDLEKIANHRGSVFGKSTNSAPRSHLDAYHMLWKKLLTLNPHEYIFIEQKSRTIGYFTLPSTLLEQIQNAPKIQIVAPLQQRLNNLKEGYPNIDNEFAKNALSKLQEKLPQNVYLSCLDSLENGLIDRFIQMILKYYDESIYYQKGKIRVWQTINTDHLSTSEIAEQIVSLVHSKLSEGH